MRTSLLFLLALIFSNTVYANCASEAVSSLAISSRDGLEFRGDAGPPLADGTFELLISLRINGQYATVKVLCSNDDHLVQILTELQYQ